MAALSLDKTEEKQSGVAMRMREKPTKNEESANVIQDDESRNQYARIK